MASMLFSSNRQGMWFLLTIVSAGAVTLACRSEPDRVSIQMQTRQSGELSTMPDPSFFKNCAFVCVDIQADARAHMTAEAMPSGWKQAGFTVEDVNEAVDYLYDVCKPNSRKVADGCRQLKLPMIFIHWGYRLPQGMDLDPDVRRDFLCDYGTEYDRWPLNIQGRESRPDEGLGVREGEFVLAKTAQDAFTSCNIDFVLRNLGAKNIVFVGGHTGACLGKTSKSAKARGYRTLCVEDATFDARQSSRLPNMKACGYDYIVTTAQFLELTHRAEHSE